VKSDKAVGRVRAGDLTVASAAWWGFDEEDSTDCIQSAINSRAKTIIIPYMGKDWIVRPIHLVSDQVILFEPGVVVLAKAGAFHGMRDCLFSGDEVNRVTLHGYNATLRMRKSDYTGPSYSTSEFRHVLFLRGSSHVSVLGLSLESSGGDGIYLGPTEDDRRIACRNVTIKDCVCRDNHRQGISVLSAEKLTIANCTLAGTRGTPPQAGIDLEPSHPRDLMVDIEVRNCRALGNAGSGFMINLERLNAQSRPVSIRILDCLVRDSREPGLGAFLTTEGAPGGYVEFRGCTVESVEYSGVECSWNVASPIELRFVNCNWRDVARRVSEAPVDLKLLGAARDSASGGIRLENCYLYDDNERYPVRLTVKTTDGLVNRVSGEIFYVNSKASVEGTKSYGKLRVVRVPEGRR
jgi:hypothetical protein